MIPAAGVMRGRRAGLAVLLLAVACSASEPAGGPEGLDHSGALSQAELEAILQEPLFGDPGPDVGGLSLQQEILRDGYVSADEYERAMVATVECLRREGFTIEGPARYPDASYLNAPGHDPRNDLSWGAVDVDDDARFDEVESRCTAQWSWRVQRVWHEQHAPSEQQRQLWLERAWTCARERGFDMEDPPTVENALDAVTAGCRPWEPEG